MGPTLVSPSENFAEKKYSLQNIKIKTKNSLKYFIEKKIPFISVSKISLKQQMKVSLAA